MDEEQHLIEKAKRFLKTAELAYADGDYDSCVSRCYYAMFFMVEALFRTEDIKASSHKDVISLFSRHFIKTEIFDKGSGKSLRKAFDMRQKGDYAAGFFVEQNEAKERLENAKIFVRKIENYLQERE